MGYLILVALWVLLAFFTAKEAAEKGRSAFTFFVLSLILPLVMWIIFSVMQPIQYQPGNVVQLVTKVNLDDGAQIPVGHRTTILGVSVIDNVRVVSITDPKGAQRWVAAKAVKLSG